MRTEKHKNEKILSVDFNVKNRIIYLLSVIYIWHFRKFLLPLQYKIKTITIKIKSNERVRKLQLQGYILRIFEMYGIC